MPPKPPVPPVQGISARAGAAPAAKTLQGDPRQWVTAAAAAWEGQELDFGSTSVMLPAKGVGDESTKRRVGGGKREKRVKIKSKEKGRKKKGKRK